MHCIFAQSFWNHLISNLCVCTSHHLLMPLTCCRMRVNVNEKYIIHIPTKPSKSVAAVPGCLAPCTARQRKTKHKAPTQFIISFIDFLFLGPGEDVCDYIVPRIYFFRLQNKLCVASQKPDLGSQCFSTFSFKRMHLNNNEEEMTTARSQL